MYYRYQSMNKLNNRQTTVAQHHAVIKQAVYIDGAKYVMPVLYFMHPDNSVHRLDILINYFKAYPTRSYDWKVQRSKGVGFLWDFLHAQNIDTDWNNTKNHRKIIRHFQLSLLNGTIDFKEIYDPLNLYWPGMSYNQAEDLINALLDFLRWCNDEEEIKSNIEINSNSKISNESLISFMYEAHYKKNLSFMSHLKSSRKFAEEAYRKSRAKVVHLNPEKPLAGYFDPVKAFPKDLIPDFLEHGFLVNPDAEHLHERIDLTGKMIALLLFYGGLRRSEPLHMWFNDVRSMGDKYEVFINHPEFAEAGLGRNPTQNRLSYLKSIGMSPRNLAKDNKSLYSGWKDLYLDSELKAQVYWINHSAQESFREMFVYYLRYRQELINLRKSLGGIDHPFLFVSKGVGEIDYRGAPYSYASFGKAWNRALSRAGKVLNLDLTPFKDNGLTPHGPRHSYGYKLSKEVDDPKIVQVALKHKHSHSQNVYTVPTTEDVMNALNKISQD